MHDLIYHHFIIIIYQVCKKVHVTSRLNYIFIYNNIYYYILLVPLILFVFLYPCQYTAVSGVPLPLHCVTVPDLFLTVPDNPIVTVMWQIHVVSCYFLSTSSSTLYTSALRMSCCFYSLAVMDPLKPYLQNQLLFLYFNYWLVNTYCRQAARPRGRIQSRTWLCLRSNETWLFFMLLEYNTHRHAVKTDVYVCVCVMKHAGMTKASLCSGYCSRWRFSDWVAKKMQVPVCVTNQCILLTGFGRNSPWGVLNTCHVPEVGVREWKKDGKERAEAPGVFQRRSWQLYYLLLH